ncbi:YfjI family protein [Fundidesulfovibrio butyratiphilus]
MQSKSPAGGPGLAEKNGKGLRTPFVTDLTRAVNQNPDLTRTPPADPDAEQSVLAGILSRPERMLDVGLTAGSFYSREHQTVFRAMLRLKEQNTPLDMLTLAEALAQSRELDLIGGRPYLAGFASGFTGNFNEAVRIVGEMETRRRLVDASLAIFDGAHDNARDLAEVVGVAQRIEQAKPAPCAPVFFEEQAPPPIPPEIVPGILREFPAALAEAVQVPFELALCNSLGAVAVAAQRKFRVQVKDGYSEGLNHYALCPLPPGERKSATVEACKRPLVEWQKQARIEAAEVIRDAESERKTLEKAIEQKRQNAGRAATPEARREIVEEIKAMERELPDVPASPRLLADDFTPEALGALMEKHGERIGLLEAEGGLFDTLAGKYSNGVPNLDAVLKFWSGEPCQIDRRGRDSIFLTDPHLTLCISPQPEIVQGLANRPGFRGRGLVGRFLFFMPQSRLGSRTTETPPIPFEVAEAWKATLHRLLALPWALDEHGEPTAYRVCLEPEAYDLWRRFSEMVETELRPGGEFEHMTDWAGKFPGQAVRLAGLFHVATVQEPHRQAITREVMQSALSVAAILAEHARAAYSLMGTDPAQECAKSVLHWIVRDRVERFTARDALQKVKGRFPTMEKVNPGLALLEERAFIFQMEADRTGPGRKPSPAYAVNPLTWEARHGVR